MNIAVARLSVILTCLIIVLGVSLQPFQGKLGLRLFQIILNFLKNLTKRIMDELIEILGTEKVLEAMIAWLPQDALDEIEADIRRDYDLDDEE